MAWAFAQSPSKSIFMNLFMMWMIGSSISIWTIMMTVMLVVSPTKALFEVNNAFKKFEYPGLSLLAPKLIYFGINLGLLGMGIYKFSVMGILPVAPFDWVGLISMKVAEEQSAVIVS